MLALGFCCCLSIFQRQDRLYQHFKYVSQISIRYSTQDTRMNTSSSHSEHIHVQAVAFSPALRSQAALVLQPEQPKSLKSVETPSSSTVYYYAVVVVTWRGAREGNRTFS